MVIENRDSGTESTSQHCTNTPLKLRDTCDRTRGIRKKGFVN